MGCFLTTTRKDLQQMQQKLQSGYPQEKSQNDSRNSASETLGVENTVSEIADNLVGAIDDIGISVEEAKEVIRDIKRDIDKAKNIPGIDGTTTAPIEQLRNLQVGSNEWNGARFELRYTASQASKIKSVDNTNYIDVQLKDGTYVELKSYSTFGTKERNSVLSQLRKDIDPNNRNVDKIKVVFDGRSGNRPSNGFIHKFQDEINGLVIELNPNAKVGCEILTENDQIITLF